MNSLQKNLPSSPASRLGNSPVSREASLASPTASLESDLRKMTNVTSGRSSCGSFENCDRGMLLARMLMAYYLPFMRPYAPTWKRRVTKSGRSVFRLSLSERTIKDTGFVCLASPRASQDFKPIRELTPTEARGGTRTNSVRVPGPYLPGEYWSVHQPPVCGMVDGLPAWMGGYSRYKERMHCYGNAVVPQQFYPVFSAIADLEWAYGY